MQAGAYWPEPSTDGCCGWCGAALTEGDIFLHELEVAAWEQGERLLAPEHPALVRGDAPIASCRACRQSMIVNYDQREQEQETKSVYERISCVVMVVMFATLCLVMLLAALGLM